MERQRSDLGEFISSHHGPTTGKGSLKYLGSHKICWKIAVDLKNSWSPNQFFWTLVDNYDFECSKTPRPVLKMPF